MNNFIFSMEFRKEGYKEKNIWKVKRKSMYNRDLIMRKYNLMDTKEYKSKIQQMMNIEINKKKVTKNDKINQMLYIASLNGNRITKEIISSVLYGSIPKFSKRKDWTPKEDTIKKYLKSISNIVTDDYKIDYTNPKEKVINYLKQSDIHFLNYNDLHRMITHDLGIDIKISSLRYYIKKYKLESIFEPIVINTLQKNDKTDKPMVNKKLTEDELDDLFDDFGTGKQLNEKSVWENKVPETKNINEIEIIIEPPTEIIKENNEEEFKGDDFSIDFLNDIEITQNKVFAQL